MSDVEQDCGFIDLNRTFHELSEDVGESGDFVLRSAFLRENRLSWTELIQEWRVIILSEAGTGKTEEIRHVAESLRAEGRAAFFLRLENIPNDFEYAFEVGSFRDFEAWLASGNEGWLLLDSVDESRLRNPRDFELAIRKLGARISVAQQRVRIVITSRTTAWRPKTDLNLCIRHVPYKPPGTKVATDSSEFEKEGPDRDLHTKNQPDNNEHSAFKIVALDDLDSNQIQIFAAAKGVADTKEFLHAVERADAWSFTARPQDLEELAAFWIDCGRIGSRSEIMHKSVERRLSERDQGRAETHPLSPTRAREGARLIAAAVTMAQEKTIRIPDGSDNAKGISVADILPDWDDKDRATLLSRPIFDEAIYGTVRFHHRSVREFLTAGWFADLLRRQTSRRKIEALPSVP